LIQFHDRALAVDSIDEPAAPSREAMDPMALGALADDMAVNGLLQPIGARGPNEHGRFEVVWGHRRLMAARILHWPGIAARVCEWSVDPLVARLSENLIRADLNAREEARQVAELRARGKPLAEIARIMRRSVGWIDARLELLTWPTELQDRVVSGELAFAVARQLAEVDHEAYRAELVAEAIRTGAPAATVSIWLAHYAADRDRIIRNRETVSEIVGRRETFQVMCTCEVCRTQADSKQTVLLRVCPRCVNALREQQIEEDRERADDPR